MLSHAANAQGNCSYLGTPCLLYILTVAEKNGSDVCADAGVPFHARVWPRSGVQSHFFNWATAHSYEWQHEVQTNVLELQAVVSSGKCRVRRAGNCNHRALLLIDSQAVRAIIAKGRTSSRAPFAASFATVECCLFGFRSSVDCSLR